MRWNAARDWAGSRFPPLYLVSLRSNKHKNLLFSAIFTFHLPHIYRKQNNLTLYYQLSWRYAPRSNERSTDSSVANSLGTEL